MISAAKLYRPSICTLGLARCLSETGPNGNVGEETLWASSVKVKSKRRKMPVTSYNLVEKHVIYKPRSPIPSCRSNVFPHSLPFPIPRLKTGNLTEDRSLRRPKNNRVAESETVASHTVWGRLRHSVCRRPLGPADSLTSRGESELSSGGRLTPPPAPRAPRPHPNVRRTEG